MLRGSDVPCRASPPGMHALYSLFPHQVRVRAVLSVQENMAEAQVIKRIAVSALVSWIAPSRRRNYHVVRSPKQAYREAHVERK